MLLSRSAGGMWILCSEHVDSMVRVCGVHDGSVWILWPEFVDTVTRVCGFYAHSM